MNKEQKLTPKYWIVNNTKTSDVYIKSAHKSKDTSIERFLFQYSNLFAETSKVKDSELFAWYLDHPDLRCDLFELKLVLEENSK